MLGWEEIVQNYIIRYFDTLHKVTKPLHDHFGIIYFTYHRISNSGHYRVLVDRPDLAERYVSDQLYLVDPFLRQPANYSSGLCLLGQHGEQKAIDKAFEVLDTVLDADMEVLLINKQEDGVEFFGFAGRTITSALPNLYLNNSGLLRTFADYFKQEMASVIKEMTEEPISLPALKGSDYFYQELVNPAADIYAHHAFLQDIGRGDMVRYALLLSPRERQCLKLLLQLTSAKNIATALGLSRRTVESYFENIRDKFCCYTKQDVLTIASTMQELGLL